jgi:pimeloyl-ACP methyl ester carboxylesterase
MLTFFSGRHWLGCMAFCCLLAVSGCASVAPEKLVVAKPMSFAAMPATVFAVNGAGDFQTSSVMLSTVLHKDGYPIDVATVEWSHGKYRVFADQVDYPHARMEGIKLATQVQEYHQLHPERPIYLFAHSAGAMVVLVALENLPPGIVERAILLAPSVSAYYDVRPALHNVKKSLNVYYSKRDTVYLGLAMYMLGTSDRVRTPAAGVVGFRPLASPEDAPLFDKLIQQPWQHDDAQLGNAGGHFGAYQPDYMRTYIFPLFDPLR